MKIIRGYFIAIVEFLMSLVQRVISTPLWAIGTIVGTLGWMFFETHFSRHPVDGPFNSWAYTVLVYTLLTMWIENFLKVQQAHQSRLQQQQMDRMEYILRFLSDQSRAVQSMLEANVKRDAIIHHLISVQNKVANQLYETVTQKDHV